MKDNKNGYIYVTSEINSAVMNLTSKNDKKSLFYFNIYS